MLYHGEMSDFIKYLEDEYRDYVSYKVLAKTEKKAEKRKILEDLASVEFQHYLFWKKYAGKHGPNISAVRVRFFLILRWFLGLTFTIKLLERHETETINAYKSLASKLDGEERTQLEKIIQEEMEHEKTLIMQIDERVVRYLGFVALGLADAIIEVSGVHAGFLGVTSSTLIAGIAGLVVGFAAAISMASAAYLQAKHGGSRHPVESAITTGGAYILTVTVLAFPYFMIADMLLAFGSSIALAIVTMMVFTYYGAVISEKGFLREFAVSLALILGTAFGTYLFGEFLGTVFGLRHYGF